MVKNVGAGAVQQIIEERQENGDYASLEDFCRRADLRQANRRVIESLVKAGALDALLGTSEMDTVLRRSILLRSLGCMEVNGTQMTRNMYRREWRRGGIKDISGAMDNG